MKRIKQKELKFVIKGTTRKAREFERALRTFADNYKDKKGVYELEVSEVNKIVVEN